MKKICFVIMGYGKKTDPHLGKTYDLDKTYHNIIKPAVEDAGYECIRGDEIQDSSVIDKNMYGLLIHADLVIADITTFNPNAIYELGVRHAARPFSTIIMKDEEGHIPFDLNHSKIFLYTHAGEDIYASEAQRCRRGLLELITKISENQDTDSPLFEFIKNLTPHVLSETEYSSIIKELAEKEKHVFALVENAKANMKEGNFIEAAKYWKNASKKATNEPFFIQQLALCTYKSKHPSEKEALMDALIIISKLDSEDKKYYDPETLGIKGAIYKNLWFLDKDPTMLDRAIDSYKDGFHMNSDYYTGENYALCTNIKASIEKNEHEKLYYNIDARKTREEIIEIVQQHLSEDNSNQRHDIQWLYATMANCLFGIGKENEAAVYEEKFKEIATADWEIQTYERSKKELLSLLVEKS